MKRNYKFEKRQRDLAKKKKKEDKLKRKQEKKADDEALLETPSDHPEQESQE
ncbi:hypothetical protein [Salidesulfovibrio onnuriiensis]|uniref:hypothetical protein n=1 Tax=Salidesulfovibrio onnuriiensis TaxID=2583823 RepID=UPI00164EFB46|nr:hypothetical protein [Salidesulfovibrio onnuriiensis]